MYRFILSIIFITGICQSSNHKNKNIAYNIPDPDCTGVFNLCTDVDKERLGRQAIKAIHEQMDDDKDGMIEASESRDFIHEELESKSDSIRHRRFQNADLHITFDDLWKQWKASPVYNWSNDDVIHWLINDVHLSIYVDYFRRNQIDGRMVPRLAANEKQYLASIMQIRDPRHKRRLIIKATDVVLFGPPRRTHNLIKDMILISALLISLVACIYAFIRHRKTQESMNMMLKELETLQKAEGDLKAVTGKIKGMENELHDKTKVDRGLLNVWFLEIQRTKEEADKFHKRRDSTIDQDKQLRLAVHEIEQLRIALRQAEDHARHQSYEAPIELIDLLKHTYHIEEMAFEAKRKLAENAMFIAKEQMNKISKMQKGFFGAVRIAHTGCMDNIGELINAAKERLADIHDEFEEREKRWNHIASLLDRNDLLSISNVTTNSPSRPKTTTTDSTMLTNTNNDSPSIKKSNSNTNIRGLTVSPFLPTQISQQDVISYTDSNIEPSSSPSSTLKRRAMTNYRSSTERLATFPLTTYSNSSNGLNGFHITSAGIDRQNTYDSSDFLLTSKQPKSLFEGIPDSSLDTNDSILDDQQQTQSNTPFIDSSNADRRSMSSEKIHRHILATKIFKPFQNIRFLKKNNT